MEFSELLKKYLDESPYNHIQFAKMCGIDRSLLQKYLKGERRPKNFDQVSVFADKLMLTEDERKQLTESYEILKSGKKLYYQRKSIHKMIEIFGELRKNEILEIDSQNMEKKSLNSGSTVITGNINVSTYLQNIFYSESVKTHCEISVLLPFYSSKVFSFITYICNKSNVSIRQILNLSQMRDDSEENNVNILIKIVPLLFGKCKYESRFYYGSQISDLATKKLMCNYILINEYLLTFDQELDSMIVIQDKIIHKLYEKQFVDIWEQSRLFGKKTNSIGNLLKIFTTENYLGIQGKPCLAMGFTKDFLRKILSDSLGNRKDIYIEEYMKCIEGIKNRKDKVFREIISREGCMEFMRHGYLGEFPKPFHKMPVTEKDRILLMRKLCQDIRDGLLDIKMIKDEYLRINKHIVINITSQEDVFFTDVGDEEEYSYVNITELSIVNAFLDYFDNYLTEEKMYSTEETIDILEDMIRTCEEKFVTFSVTD